MDKNMLCIYCEKNESKQSFNGREHVIPVLLGTFKENLVIHDFVCDNCNSVIFNALETDFKEDTEEGVTCQQFDLHNSYQVRLKNKNFKFSVSMGLGDDIFNQIFPFLTCEDGKLKIILKDQIRIKNPDSDRCLILRVDRIKELKPKNFSKLKERLRGVMSKNISILVEANDSSDKSHLAEAIALIRRLGIPYEEEKNTFTSMENASPSIAVKGTINNDAGRIFAKIAFNYFAYCAIQSGNSEVLFHSNFKTIKSYILGFADLPIKEIITSIETTPIIWDEANMGDGIRMLAHIVTFSEIGDKVVAKVSFFGNKIYTIILGTIPKELKKQTFGSGHIFDPFQKRIEGLTQNPAIRAQGKKIGYSIYNRI